VTPHTQQKMSPERGNEKIFLKSVSEDKLEDRKGGRFLGKLRGENKGEKKKARLKTTSVDWAKHRKYKVQCHPEGYCAKFTEDWGGSRKEDERGRGWPPQKTTKKG